MGAAQRLVDPVESNKVNLWLIWVKPGEPFEQFTRVLFPKFLIFHSNET